MDWTSLSSMARCSRSNQIPSYREWAAWRMKKGRKCPIPQIRANLPLRNFFKTLLFLTGVAPGVVGYERLEMIVGVMVGKPCPLLPYHDAFQECCRSGVRFAWRQNDGSI